MTPRDFCYWMQGLFELSDPTVLTSTQVELIKRHLEMVKITVAGVAPTTAPAKRGDDKPEYEAMC